MSGYAIAAAGLIGVGLSCYLLFGGADFGAGVWHLIGRREERRRVIEQAMGPIWEANHVWLIFSMVVTWTAFPPVFAHVMSEYWIPLSVVVFGIVARGSAFAFRKALPGHRGHGLVFGIASVVTPFVFGAVAGSLVTGAAWWSWTGMVTGTLAVALCGYLAAVYLAWDARRLAGPEMADRFRSHALWAGVVAGTVVLAGLVVLPETVGFAVREPYVAVSAVAGATSLALLRARRYLVVRVTAAVAAVTVLWGAAADAAGVLDLSGAAALDQVLVLVFSVLGGGALVLVPCLVWLYTLFQRADTRVAEAPGKER